MALLFDKPMRITKSGRDMYTCRLASTLKDDSELLSFCKRQRIPTYAIENGAVHIFGGQITAARLAGAKEIDPRQMQQIIRSKLHG